MNRQTLALLPFLSLATVALAQSDRTTVLEDFDHRPAVSLDGDWHVIVDPYFSGRYDFHHEERKDGFFLNAHGKPGDDRPVEYDFAKSPTLKVPGDWNTQRDSLYLYEGPVWYQRNFDYSAKPGHRVFLHIGAANSQISFQKPLIMSEFGGGAKAGLHGKEDDRWTEEYQAQPLSASTRHAEQNPPVARYEPLGTDGLSLTLPAAAGNSGQLQSQGSGL